ncbi:alpha/beta hydrolase [Gordonia soli]|uniref:DUF1023 domain-containing protein n=1 Tax=Gordonia soli NBRC 108243 TaxID=1223545 RepID=M0QLP4_9ACTN|nr:alpha/beta hydrolase [Gordonia soli]GAC68317.1 hypothetical protein GS4_14_01500 [Gordonia soli NBRC 108243]
MDLTTIDRWDTGALDTMADTLGKRVTTVADVESSLRTAGRLEGWFGGGADSARELYRVTAAELTDEAAVLGAAKRLASDTSSAVTHLKSQLASLRADAAAESMTIHADGSVTGAPDVPEDERAAHEQERLRIEAAAKALIAQAVDIDSDADKVFADIRDGKITARGATTIEDATRAGEEQGALTPPTPPADPTPQQAKAYWDAMDADQQQQVLREHPDWIGNVDGIPAAVRHQANTSRIDSELTRLEARRDKLEEQLDDHWFGGTFTNEDAELEHVEKKIEDVKKLRELIGEDSWSPENPDGRMLLLMDMQSGEQGMAAVAIGNPDDADHVSVTTPGLDTNIRNSLGSMLGESDALRDETNRQLNRAGSGAEKVSTISWLGFEPPDNDSSRPPGVPYLEVAQQDRAAAGADDLADFYRGLAVTNKDDPHLVALGHSYGSLTQGLALQEPGGHPVDDAIFYGSPGFEANDEPELGLRQGHGFVMEGDDDFISYAQSMGPVGPNGPDPSSTDLVQLDVGDRATADGVERQGAHTHSDYPRNGDNGELRVSGYLMARVLAGLTPQ